MRRSKQLGLWMAGLVVIAGGSPAWADPATQSTTQPAVASLLADIDSAYAKLQSAQFDGHMVAHFDAGGQQKNDDIPFTSSFAAPNQFRHEITNEITLGSTGRQVYEYLSSRQEYQTADAPKARAASADWPGGVSRILKEQNPSLMLALSKSAQAELTDLSGQITLQPPTVIDGISYDTLRFDAVSGSQIITILVDPASHLLHEVKFDLRKAMEDTGATDVKAADFTIDYTKAISDPPLAANVFAWTAPVGATLASASNALAMADDGMSDDLKALIGKDAPDFSLKGLDDKTVKLSDQKGSVVIVDLWATWCGPCVAALPHLDKLYKDQSANGLKVLAVNLQEDKDKVKDFVTKQGWSLPVLLDSDGAVATSYKADSIPETVVIGKDGKIKQIFIGGGNEDAIAALVATEMKK